MKRPTKAEIRAAVEKLRVEKPGNKPAADVTVGKLSEKKSSQRIRKQGV